MFKSSKTKRITAVILAVLLILSVSAFLSACGNQTSESGAPKEDVKNLQVYGYDDQGNPTSYYKNQYDDAGNLVMNSNYNSKGELLGSTKYEYNSKGQETKFVVYDAFGKVQSQGQKEYDSKDRLIQYTDIDKDGNVKSIIKREYDDKTGKETRVLNYDSEGNLVTYEEYEYDAEGNNTKLTKYDSKGKVKYYIEYTKDENGKEISTRYDAEGNVISE